MHLENKKYCTWNFSLLSSHVYIESRWQEQNAIPRELQNSSGLLHLQHGTWQKVPRGHESPGAFPEFPCHEGWLHHPLSFGIVTPFRATRRTCLPESTNKGTGQAENFAFSDQTQTTSLEMTDTPSTVKAGSWKCPSCHLPKAVLRMPKQQFDDRLKEHAVLTPFISRLTNHTGMHLQRQARVVRLPR